MAKLVDRPDPTTLEQAYVPAIAKGLGVTIQRFVQNTFSKDKQIATIRYPDEQRVYPERFRGIHRLTHREDGSPRCVACLCCSTACPAQCIHIEPAEYDPDDPRYGYERYPKAFVIDELRCIFCGYCVEACPCDAIRMDSGVHIPVFGERGEAFLDRNDLMSRGSLSVAKQGGELG